MPGRDYTACQFHLTGLSAYGLFCLLHKVSESNSLPRDNLCREDINRREQEAKNMHGSDIQEENRTIPAADSTGNSGRRYDLDWLRVLVIINMVPWHMGMAAEFAAISFLSFAVILASYELMVKRTKVTRFLFGMKV